MGLRKTEKDGGTIFILNVQYFKKWSTLKVQRLSSSVFTQTYKRGEAIFEVGDPTETFYILKKGKVLIQMFTAVQQQNKWPVSPREWRVRKIDREYLVTLAMLRPGKVFGEIDLVEDCPRQMRALAIENCECLQVRKSDFKDIFSSTDKKRLMEEVTYSLPMGRELQRRVIKEIEDRHSQRQAWQEAMKGSPMGRRWERRKSTQSRIVREQKQYEKVKLN